MSSNKFSSGLDPAAKMWNFSLEDYQQLSTSIWDLYLQNYVLLHLFSFLAAVEEAAAVASVSLRPLEGMDSVDLAAPARDAAALTALLKLCNGWQKPGAGLQGQCVLVSPTKFEVDVGYNVDVIAAFKLMPTKNYGKKELIFLCFLDDFSLYYI